MKDLKLVLYKDITDDFNKNKDAYMFYLYPLVFKIKTKQFDDKCYSLFSKIKKEKVKKFDFYKMNKYLKKDYSNDIIIILKAIFQSSYLTKTNEYALDYIKKLTKKPSTMKYINLIYRLLSDVKDSKKTGGGRFGDFLANNIFKRNNISNNSKVINTNDINFYDTYINNDSDYVRVFFMIRKVIQNLTDYDINSTEAINAIFKQIPNIFVFNVTTNKYHLHNEISEKIKDMLNIILKIFEITQENEEYIEGTTYKISRINEENMSDFNELKKYFSELLKLLREHNIILKDINLDDIKAHCYIRKNTHKQCIDLLEKEIKNFVSTTNYNNLFIETINKLNNKNTVLSEDLMKDYKSLIANLNKNYKYKYIEFVKNKMVDFLKEKNYNSMIKLNSLNPKNLQDFVFEILREDIINGGKGIIRNHKLQYLIKKIYKDIKILTLN
jgi:hypothetical protein